MNPSLLGLLPDELSRVCDFKSAFRGRQLFSWISRGESRFSRMTDLPEAVRLELESLFALRTARESGRLEDTDATVKLRLSLEDGEVVECVLLRDENGRRTACLSTQAGCAMGCAFCRTGLIGLRRDLGVSEIVEQYHRLVELDGPIGNVVYMGMGEPLANLGAVEASFRYFTHHNGLALSPRRITVSTCGLVPGIRALAERSVNCYLAVSLISADEDLRRRLMPAAGRFSLAELRSALEHHHRAIGKRLTVEIVLLRDLNDSRAAADALIEFCRGLDVIVNLIPWNPVPELSFTEPGRDRVDRFFERLAEAGLPVTCRYRRGLSIGGACGQLGVLP